MRCPVAVAKRVEDPALRLMGVGPPLASGVLMWRVCMRLIVCGVCIRLTVCVVCMRLIVCGVCMRLIVCGVCMLFVRGECGFLDVGGVHVGWIWGVAPSASGPWNTRARD